MEYDQANAHMGDGDKYGPVQACAYLKDGTFLGCEDAQAVRVTVYITDMENLKAIHEVPAEYFKGKYSASTLVEVSRLTTQGCMG